MATAKAVVPDYAYLKLRCDPGTSDEITWKLMLTRSITKFAGIHGSAIPLDLVWISKQLPGGYSEAIVRCPGANQDIVSSGISSAASEDGHHIKLMSTSNHLPMLL